MQLHEYWASYPPLHVMVRNYLGYEDQQPSPEEVAQVLRSVGGSGRAPKISQAPQRDREIFERMNAEAKKHPPKGKRAR